MDDLTKRGPEDAARININEDHEVRYWTGKFGCSEEALRVALAAHGVMAKDVEAALRPRGGDAPFVDFIAHAGDVRPYADDQLVDVVFRDGRKEFSVRASFYDLAMWNHSWTNADAWIDYHRPASNRFHLGGLPAAEE